MLTHPFSFHAPRSLPSALDLLAGDDAKVLAGGMSLMPVMNLGLARPSTLVSVNHLPGLDHVVRDGDTLVLGARTRHHVVATHALVVRDCPVLAAAAGRIGDVQVRHRGTLGGSIAHADPSADYLPVLVATGAAVVVASVRGERVLPVADLLTGIMTTALEEDEMITEVRVPAGEGLGGSYVRLARLEGSFAIANAACVFGEDRLRVAVGGVAPSPVAVELPLAGRSRGDLAAEVAEKIAAALRDSDDDGGDLYARYRRAVAPVCARRAVEQAWAQR